MARTPLVRIYCEELLRGIDGDVAAERNDAEWAMFVTRLETGAAFEAAGIPSDRVQRCLPDHADEMEEGEFVLDGRRLLREQQRVARKAPSPLDPVLGSIRLPGFGDVLLTSPTQGVDAVAAEKVMQRSNRYDSLWSSFVSHLRKTMTVRREALKMKLSVR